jgi:hypothetical protein
MVLWMGAGVHPVSGILAAAQSLLATTMAIDSLHCDLLVDVVVSEKILLLACDRIYVKTRILKI